MNQPWQRRACLTLRVCSLPFFRVSVYTLFVTLRCFLLLVNVSCGQAVSGISSPTASSSVNRVSPRNHVSPNGYWWRLVNVTFTTKTTYVQAQTILSTAGMSAYPMVNPLCGDLQKMGAPIPVSSAASPTLAPTPMSPEELQTFFEQFHRLLAQTSSWEKLNQVATVQDVISVDPFPLPKSCPAHAPT